MRQKPMHPSSPLQSAFPAGRLVVCAAFVAACAEPSFSRDFPSEAGTGDAESESADAAALDGAVAADARRDAGAFTTMEAGIVGDGRAPERLDALAPSDRPAVSDGAPASEPDANGAPGADHDASSADGAATPNADGADANVPSVPAWIDQAVGSYAVRVWAYAYDGAWTTLTDGTHLAEIKREGDEYQLVATRCGSVANNTVASLVLPNPEVLGPKRHRIIVSGSTFSTQALDTAEGFEAAPPPECTGKLGELVPKRPHQDWLASSCRCGGALAPTRDDCRVLDPDDDGQPGMTYKYASNLSAARFDLYSVTIDESRFIDIMRGPDGAMRGLFEGRSAAIQFGCRPSNCSDLSGPVGWCPAASYTLVQFAPLATRMAPPEGWTCAAMFARESELFPELPPPSPSTCGR